MKKVGNLTYCTEYSLNALKVEGKRIGICYLVMAVQNSLFNNKLFVLYKVLFITFPNNE